MADDRTDEEILADELAAELEAEFADGVDEEPAGPEAAEGDGAPADDARRPSSADPSPVVQPSKEALERARAQAKPATHGDVEGALGALEAQSETAYTRHPIVSVLGHVDHGKTSILDRIRGTKVFDREAGAITQHIGASEVPLETIYQRAGPLLASKKFTVPGILCIDTPGHHAFASLRARGGALADIAVLVVDLNEGFKPQTLEALNILKRSKTPFVVAANKVDRTDDWKTADGPFILNVKRQSPRALAAFDDKFYTLVAAFYDQGMPAERYDRIKDFTREIAIVPTSATSGEGIPDLLAMLVGLAQKFLEQRLVTDEEMPGEGTVLEIKEDKGLGIVLDVILYAGAIRRDDRILLGTSDEPLEARMRALLKPAALDEMRDARFAFKDVDEAVAAAGLKLVCPGIEGVVAGAPLRVLRGDNDEAAYDAVRRASRPRVPLAETGVHIKADTIGGLEALAGELGAMEIPIRSAAVGPVSRRDVVEAAAMTDPLYRCIIAFNVKMLPEVEDEARERGLEVFLDPVIYSLLDNYHAWLKARRDEMERAQRQEYIHPAKVRFLPGCAFRQRDPAVFGVRVLAGSLQPGRMLIREDGKAVGRIRSIQKESKTVTFANQGDEVALSVPGPTIGRQVKEEDILYLDIPESHAKWLQRQGKLNTDEREVLSELIRVRRKTERFWAM